MKRIITFTILLLSFTAQGQEYMLQTIPPVCDTTSIWPIFVIPRPVMNTSTGINAWVGINDTDHKSVNVASITATSSHIRVNFTHKAYKICNFGFGRDESTGAISYGTPMSGQPQIVSKGYTCGARVYLDYAEIYISKPSQISVWAQWDTTGVDHWQQGSYLPASLPLNSIPFVITNKTDASKGIDYIEVSSTHLFAAQGTPMFNIPYNNRDPRFLLTVKAEQVWNALHHLVIFDSSGNALPKTNYPHGMRIDMCLGVTEVEVNPLTERFGQVANFWFSWWMIGTRQQ